MEYSTKYRNVTQWIDDINLRRRSDSWFEEKIRVARDTRLAVGGIKNLLSGVTTVAHHDPLYPCLLSTAFPVGVVTQYGWSHSLYIDGAAAVAAAYHRTPPAWPWIIHAGEGIDEEAATEWSRLEGSGCVGPNTLVVHGVALDEAAMTRLVQAGGGLIWCPSSNLRLFGKTADVRMLARSGRVALGTDSRLSGSRDLLEELRLVAQIGDLDESSVEALVTRSAAGLLRLPDRGALGAGLRADIVVLRRGVTLTRACRTDVRLVLRDGRPYYGDIDLTGVVAPQVRWVELRLDGQRKALDPQIANFFTRLGGTEAGLELCGPTWRAA